MNENEIPDTVEAVEEAQEIDQEEGRPAEGKLRKRAQAAEAERDRLAEMVANLQRRQVESMLRDIKPEALWTVADLADMISEDGTVDPEKVSEAVEATRERLGIPKPAKGNFVPNVGNQPAVLPSPDRWSEAFAPKRR